MKQPSSSPNNGIRGARLFEQGTKQYKEEYVGEHHLERDAKHALALQKPFALRYDSTCTRGAEKNQSGIEGPHAA